MRSVRRTYFYLISLISLEVMVWGSIDLCRTLTHLENLVGGTSLIAKGLSLALVGLPVFIIHWRVAQGEAKKDPEEASSWPRELFLYGGLLITLIPIVQNVLTLVDRMFLNFFNLGDIQNLFGSSEPWSDNLIAVVINGAAGYFLSRVLANDWHVVENRDHLVDSRRLYRFVWMVYGLGLSVFGVQQLTHFIVAGRYAVGGSPVSALANGMALVVIGAPVWVWSIQRTDELLVESGERESMTRRVILYILALAGVGSLLTAAGLVVSLLLRRVLGESGALQDFLSDLSGPLSVAVPLGGVWAYYSYRLRQDIKLVADTPRRAALRRLYYYILAFSGLVATVLGMRNILSFIVQMALGGELILETLRDLLANGIACLVVGLPLWRLTWGPMQTEAAQETDTGWHARRSVIRKGYLYLALFTGVIFTMVAAGAMLYEFFNGMFGVRPADFAVRVCDLFVTAVLLLAWTLVHLRALREDGRRVEKALAATHAAFPVIMLDLETAPLGNEVTAVLQRIAPEIPVVVQNINQGAPGPEMAGAKAVVIPASLTVKPPEALRIWLEAFAGKRLVVPDTTENWLWLGSMPANKREQANWIASALRQMAEGQPVRPPAAQANPFVILGAIFAAFLGLQVLAMVLSLIFQ